MSEGIRIVCHITRNLLKKSLINMLIILLIMHTRFRIVTVIVWRIISAATKTLANKIPLFVFCFTKLPK